MSDEDRIRGLIEASSLGTPAARALRARTTDQEVALVRKRMRELMEEDSPWVAGDGTHWLHFPVFGEWWGWTPGEDGLYCYPEQEFRAVYPDAPPAT